MQLTIKWLKPEGWDSYRYCLVNEAGTIVCHRDKHADAREMVRRLSGQEVVIPQPSATVEVVYEGRSGSKLSILSAYRRVKNQRVPLPEPGAVYAALYPERAA